MIGGGLIAEIDGLALSGRTQSRPAGSGGRLCFWFCPVAPIGIFLGKNVLEYGC
jgi:hypothetical protein